MTPQQGPVNTALQKCILMRNYQAKLRNIYTVDDFEKDSQLNYLHRFLIENRDNPRVDLKEILPLVEKYILNKRNVISLK